jgi:hypothetical protein
MAHAGGNVDPVARPRSSTRSSARSAAAPPRQQDDELVARLVVPEAGLAGLAGRDDALDTDAGTTLDQLLDLLFGLARLQRW